MSATATRVWNLAAALAVLAFGLFVVWQASRYPLGTVARMGSGFYPMALGVVLTGLALVNLLDTWRAVPESFEFRLRPVLWIGLSLVSFAMTVRWLGLVPATFALVLIASLADSQSRPLQVVLTALGLSAAGVAVFIYGLRLPLAVVNW